jgi:hypothetical protein
MGRRDRHYQSDAMKITCVYKPRDQSYDEDWISAFRAVGAEIVKEQTKDADLTVFMHSYTGQQVDTPAFKPKGKVLILVVNEFKLTHERNQLAAKLNATIGSQLMPEDARALYGDNFISVPHAMNPDIEMHTSGRRFDIGVRGAKYKIQDGLRNRICNPELWEGLRRDIEIGKIYPAKVWRAALKTWKVMPSCEGGHERGKIMTPRHFEAIASGTGLVMYPGRYNDILRPENYIELKLDHSNLTEVKERIISDISGMTKSAREYMLETNTYAHRVQQIIEWSKS